MFWRRGKNERRVATLRTVTGALALLGVAIMAYLTSLHYGGAGVFCDFGEGFSCSTVNQGVYSEIAGIPVSVLGLVYFAGIAVLMFARRFKGVFTWSLLATIFSLVFGVYLSAIEHFVIGTICLYCELSKVLMFAIIGTSVAGADAGEEDVPLEWIAWVVVLGFLFSYVAWLLQRV